MFLWLCYAVLLVAAPQRGVSAYSDSFQSQNERAAAFCRKGRDTEDIAVYNQAGLALDRSLKISPGNYEARKLQITVLLGKHEFSHALKLAKELNRKVPDDIAGWASLVEANIALGNYDEAEKDAQWILDLRPGSTLGFEEAAALREWFGDIPGAIEFFDESNRRTSGSDADQHAWLLTRKARLQLQSGYTTEAEAQLTQVFQLRPDSLLATKVLADVRIAQRRYSDAALLLAKRYERVQSARNLYDWAMALEKCGQQQQASALLKQFAAEAEAEKSKPYNANRELVLYYLSAGHDSAAALRLATQLTAERHDSSTLDAYAWALFHNERLPEAKVQMERALAVGVRDPTLFCHALQIAVKMNDTDGVAKYRKELATFK